MVKISIEALKNLTVPERIQLAEKLRNSIVDVPGALPLTDAQRTEIEHRLTEHSLDPSSAIPWDEIRKQLRERVR